MLEHRYDIRISESYVDPNPIMVEIQDPDNFTRFQTRKRCALEIAAYVFNNNTSVNKFLKITTVLPAKSDGDVMFCLQSYQGLIIGRSLVY